MKTLIRKILLKYCPGFFHKLRQFNYENYVLPKEFMAHVNRLSASHLTIDVGANVGSVSETIARRGARVIAFEPNSSAFTRLEKLAQKYPNIDPRNEAAGTSSQQTKLYLHKDAVNTSADLTQASSLLGSKPNISHENCEIVDEVDFSAFLKSLNEPVELVKMDIEGYEIQVLNHLLDTNALDNIGSFYVETHERKFTDLSAPTEALKARIKREGYEGKFFFDWH